MTKPRFITFTGADVHTSINEMTELSAQFPIEWGILLSPRHQGSLLSKRYPMLDFVSDVLEATLLRNKARISAHLCGRHVRDLLSHGTVDFPLDRFDRAQVNNVEIGVEANVDTVQRWADANLIETIMQCTGERFPRATGRVKWLFDQSCGAGIVPGPAPSIDFVGYAGGIRPSNAAEIVAKIEAAGQEDYWIDMENGVRDENDCFSIAKCRAVCEAVYGPSYTR